MTRYLQPTRNMFALKVSIIAIAMLGTPAAAQEQPGDNEMEAQTADEPDSMAAPPDLAGEETADSNDDAYYAYVDPAEEGPDEVEPDMGGDDPDNGTLDPDSDEPGIREPPEIPSVERGEGPSGPSQAVPRSFGGFRVLDAKAPFQAQIYYPGTAKRWVAPIKAGTKPLWEFQHYCGGALIAQDWVVTAGHCIDQDMVASGYRVRLGQENISVPGGIDYKIDKIVKHTRSSQYDNDIALIHIVADANQPQRSATQIRPIPLAEGNAPRAGDTVTGYGWGKTKEGSRVANAFLMGVPLEAMDQAKCAALPGKTPEKIHPGVVCAAAPAKKTCRGDSGGPLVNKAGQLVGIVSWGSDRCADDSAPGVYVRVSSYTTWIKAATGGAVR